MNEEEARALVAQMVKRMPGVELGRDTRQAFKMLQLLTHVLKYFESLIPSRPILLDGPRQQIEALKRAEQAAFDIIAAQAKEAYIESAGGVLVL